MSLRKYGNQRDANEPEIIAALEKVGATVYPLDLPWTYWSGSVA